MKSAFRLVGIDFTGPYQDFYGFLQLFLWNFTQHGFLSLFQILIGLGPQMGTQIVRLDPVYKIKT